jgi:23S rRNA pseudouridine1911/1915/1917 synthase
MRYERPMPTPRPKQTPARGQCMAVGASTLAVLVRQQGIAPSCEKAKALVISGKVTVDGARITDPAFRLAGGESIAWNMAVPDPRRQLAMAGFRVVFEDGHLIIIEKPEGVTTVPYERKDTGTALDLVREAWRRQGKRATVTPLYTVHRLDKDTSGLLCFAKTKLAERGLHQIFKNHLASREYLAVAHGRVTGGRIESRLVENRGDGIRGSTQRPHEGQQAITFVEVVETFSRATLCRVRLQTGRTHQIRIHLSEQGHPLVGETVYIRDLLRAGRTPLPTRRLLLHAATLGFDHPVTGARLDFSSPLPEEFQAELKRLRE